jgi:hypothetical protein
VAAARDEGTDSFEGFNEEEDLPRQGPNELEEDRKPAARQSDVEEELELPSSSQSSFYQAAVAAARDEGTDSFEGFNEEVHLPRQASNSYFYQNAMKNANESVPPQKKPGIQYVEEPAVNVDSVMYQMEYEDYPTPNQDRGLQDDTDLGDSFLHGAASMAVADSPTDKTLRPPPELSSFYQEAMNTRRASEMEYGDDTDQMATTDETLRPPPELSSFYQAAMNSRRGSDTMSPVAVVQAQNSSAQKKPGVQYVEESAVNVDSVMYQMEYGDYPRPNQR